MQLVFESYYMFKRNVLLSIRNLDAVISAIVVPVFMMVLFVYVFGGAVAIGEVNYVDFVVPGVLLQCICQGAATVAVSLSQDLKSGMVERFSALNIRTSSFLIGHVVASILKNMVCTLIVIFVAMLLGFRPAMQIEQILLVFLLIFVFTSAITWIAMIFGLLAKSPEAAAAFTIVISVLPYLSSGFVPVDTMPRPLALFAQWQPMTSIIDTLRALMLGFTPTSLSLAFTWSIGLLIVAWGIAVTIHNRKVHLR